MSEIPEIKFKEWHHTSTGEVVTCVLKFADDRYSVGMCVLHGRDKDGCFTKAAELAQQDAIDKYLAGDTYYLDEQYIEDSVLCDHCGDHFDVTDMAYIGSDSEKCSPFMDMTCICFGCFDEWKKGKESGKEIR